MNSSRLQATSPVVSGLRRSPTWSQGERDGQDTQCHQSDAAKDAAHTELCWPTKGLPAPSGESCLLFIIIFCIIHLYSFIFIYIHLGVLVAELGVRIFAWKSMWPSIRVFFDFFDYWGVPWCRKHTWSHFENEDVGISWSVTSKVHSVDRRMSKITRPWILLSSIGLLSDMAYTSHKPARSWLQCEPQVKLESNHFEIFVFQTFLAFQVQVASGNLTWLLNMVIYSWFTY